MKSLIFVVLFFVPLCCFAQHDPRIDLYNEYFQKKDFANALSVADSLIASFPDSMEFHREKAKMLAATDQRDAFLEQMQLIRNAANKDNVSTFFSALSHELVKRDFRDELRRFYHAAKDTQVLLNWPSFDYETVVDCKGLVKIPVEDEPVIENPTQYDIQDEVLEQESQVLQGNVIEQEPEVLPSSNSSFQMPINSTIIGGD